MSVAQEVNVQHLVLASGAYGSGRLCEQGKSFARELFVGEPRMIFLEGHWTKIAKFMAGVYSSHELATTPGYGIAVKNLWSDQGGALFQFEASFEECPK